MKIIKRLKKKRFKLLNLNLYNYTAIYIWYFFSGTFTWYYLSKYFFKFILDYQTSILAKKAVKIFSCSKIKLSVFIVLFLVKLNRFSVNQIKKFTNNRISWVWFIITVYARKYLNHLTIDALALKNIMVAGKLIFSLSHLKPSWPCKVKFPSNKAGTHKSCCKFALICLLVSVLSLFHLWPGCNKPMPIDQLAKDLSGGNLTHIGVCVCLELFSNKQILIWF